MKLLVLLLFPLAIMQATEEKEEPWFTMKLEYEGFPLLLRYPQERDYEEVESEFPRFIVVTHNLKEVTHNGLPEKEYNRSLIDFDLLITGSFEHIVLIETFGGKRTYYGYIPESLNLDSTMEVITKEYPNESIEWESKSVKNWSFIKTYSADFNLYPKKD